MKAIRIIGAVAASALFATAAIAQDISGSWAASFDSQVGKQTYTFSFKVDGATLTGHSKSNIGESDLKGTVSNGTVTFVENLDYQGQMLAITYAGQITSADAIQFKRDVAGQGGEEFTATRQK